MLLWKNTKPKKNNNKDNKDMTHTLPVEFRPLSLSSESFFFFMPLRRWSITWVRTDRVAFRGIMSAERGHGCQPGGHRPLRKSSACTHQDDSHGSQGGDCVQSQFSSCYTQTKKILVTIQWGRSHSTLSSEATWVDSHLPTDGSWPPCAPAHGFLEAHAASLQTCHDTEAGSAGPLLLCLTPDLDARQL